MTILAKFSASLSGFWWSLDERERLLVAGAGLWLALSALALLGERERRSERQRVTEETARLVLARLEERRGA